MAIKVKHEGNATSRLMASGAGGNGRRRAEDAKLFLQVASQENMANRRVQEPRLIQAHAQAPSAAPLVQAHAGGNAPLIGAPNIPQPHPNYGGGGGGGTSPVTSPGGFKEKKRGVPGGDVAGGGGGGGGLAARRKVADLFRVKDGHDIERDDKAKNTKWELRDSNGNVLKTYTDGELESVRRRGNGGAALDEYDAQAFFRDAGGITDREREDQVINQNIRGKLAVANANADAAEKRLQMQLEARKEEQESEAANAREMYTHKITQQQKLEIDAINEAYENARKSGDYTEEELKELRRQRDAKLLGIKPIATAKEEPAKPNIQEVNGRKYIQNGDRWDPIDEPTPPPTAEQAFGGTYTDPQTGKRYGLDKNNRLYEVGGVDQQAANRQKFILDNIKNATNIGGTPLTGDALKAEMKRLGEMYDAAMSSVQPEPPPQPQPAQPSANASPAPTQNNSARRERWSSFAD